MQSYICKVKFRNLPSKLMFIIVEITIFKLKNIHKVQVYFIVLTIISFGDNEFSGLTKQLRYLLSYRKLQV